MDFQSDTLYVEMSGGKWVGYVYSDGQRYQVISTYDWERIEKYAKKYGDKILKF